MSSDGCPGPNLDDRPPLSQLGRLPLGQLIGFCGPGWGGAYLAVVTLHVVVSVHGHDADGLVRALDPEEARTTRQLGGPPGSTCQGGCVHVGGILSDKRAALGEQQKSETGTNANAKGCIYLREEVEGQEPYLLGSQGRRGKTTYGPCSPAPLLT